MLWTREENVPIDSSHPGVSWLSRLCYSGRNGGGNSLPSSPPLLNNGSDREIAVSKASISDQSVVPRGERANTRVG